MLSLITLILCFTEAVGLAIISLLLADCFHYWCKVLYSTLFESIVEGDHPTCSKISYRFSKVNNKNNFVSTKLK